MAHVRACSRNGPALLCCMEWESVASPPAKEKMLTGMMHAIDEDKDGEEINALMKETPDLIHLLSKLGQWTDTPTKHCKTVLVMQHLLEAICTSAVHSTLRDLQGSDKPGELEDKDIVLLSRAANAFSSLADLSAGDFVTGTCAELFGDGPAREISVWSATFEKVVEAQLEAMNAELAADVREQSKKVEAALEGFGPASERPLADELKKLTDALTRSCSKASSLKAKVTALSKFDLSDLDEANSLLATAKDSTLVWGFQTLLARKNITDPAKGLSDRQRMRNLYDNNIKGAKREILPQCMVDSIMKVLEVDNVEKEPEAAAKGSKKRKSLG